ncbi:MAG: GNAT family N-acetyltransferase [Oscillospiraceae bacterium]
MESIDIKELDKENIPEALELVWKVFGEYEAPVYTEEGIKEFYSSIHDDKYLSQLRMYGAFDGAKLVGVIAVRGGGTHIALFFVDGKYHRRGIGKALFQTVLKRCAAERMTVNASPYAVPVYRRLGFSETDTEQTVCGLRFTPMALQLTIDDPPSADRLLLRCDE